MVALSHKNANELVQSLPKLPGEARVAQVDERTNSIILVGPLADIDRFAETLRTLDR